MAKLASFTQALQNAGARMLISASGSFLQDLTGRSTVTERKKSEADAGQTSVCPWFLET